MHSNLLRWLLFAAACARLISAQATAAPVTLRPQKIVREAVQLGWEVQGTVPERALAAQIGGDKLLLWDLDGDGKLTIGKDGLSLPGGRFVVALPPVLLLATGQYTLAFPEADRMTATAQALDLPTDMVEDAAAMTRIRLRAGVPPLALDLQACRDCLAHCDYLRQNPPDLMSLTPHDEHPGKPGYTENGAQAGRMSCIYYGSDVGDALAWCGATLWHGIPILDPSVQRFGVGNAHGFVLVFPQGAQPLTHAFSHPADGATDIPREFAKRGEQPNPSLGSDYGKGCGMPILVKLPLDFGSPLVKATVTDERGRAVAGTQSCPRTPANPTWPTNSQCAAFVPSAPLKAGTRYHVRFEFEAATLEWNFTTSKK